ncbi:50S ribosomal protein L18 [Candidatus Endowatersipora endosymbiont of Watersipora subatra]|uniref:50S ribosomal protein L18 n=1 Tax=Candidatus Endowatersipora endosymbiont of Watersipora subatra TaxID=3077946 RepID=UPI00312CBA55
MENCLSRKQRRAARVRRKLKKNIKGRPRLSVHRSNMNIYAQVIDDIKGITLAAASTLEKDTLGKGGDIKAAQSVGKLIAERACKAGVNKVIFDRGSFLFHGRVKALADSAREAGLKF